MLHYIVSMSGVSVSPSQSSTKPPRPSRSSRAKKSNEPVQPNASDLSSSSSVVVIDRQDASKTSTANGQGGPEPVVKANPDNILELRTINGTKIKDILESLKHVIVDTNMVFTETGLKITMVDTVLKICAAFLSLDASYFELYHCPQRLVLGVDISWLYKIIKPLKMTDQLSFIVHKDRPGVLQIVMDNTENGTSAKYSYILKDVEEQYEIRRSFEFDIPPPQINSAYFQRICRELHGVREEQVEIEITHTPRLDKLVIRGLKNETSPEYKVDVPVLDGETIEGDETKVVKGKFLLAYLQNFTKAAHKLSPMVRISLEQDNYLLIEYIIIAPNDTTRRNSLKYLLFQHNDSELEKVRRA